MADQSWNQQYALYLPRTLVEWQLEDNPDSVLETDGTFLLVDISGFTALSELLAGKGKVGAEEVTEILNGAFTELLDIAIEDGGDLLRFGGDALFHLYRGPDHAARACRSALDMRDALEDFQKERSPTPLEMSVGVSSGPISAFLAGKDSKELLFVGPTASEVVRLQDAAHAGEILASLTTVGEVGEEFFGNERDGGRVLEGDPDPDDEPIVDELGESSDIDLASFIPSQLRGHVSLAFNEGEHRPATIAFVSFTGTDDLFTTATRSEVAETLDRLVALTQDVALKHGVTFLASDVNRDGGKLILTTGVPNRSPGHGERMLRALREIVDSEPPLPVHIGVARGHVFAGDLGARFRRVYTVMGDSVNLAARLAAQAESGEILVTARALDRSDADWEATQRSPIELKGKSKPVAPFSIGAMVELDSAHHEATLPLIGRSVELEQLMAVADVAVSGRGAIVNVTGPAGIGKTRLIEEVTERLSGRFESIFVDSEQYETATPYFVAGRLVRSLLHLKSRAPDDLGEDLETAITSEYPSLAPWLPLFADVIGANVPPTAEVEALSKDFVEAKLHEVVISFLRQRWDAPALLVVDDAHWLDDSSRAVLDAIGVAASDQPWMVALVGRFDQGQAMGGEEAAHLELDPLTPDASLGLIAAAADTAVPLPVGQAIAQRSGGNPFYLVELAKGGIDLEQQELPETIEAVTLAAIDRLEPRDRRLLRTASVFGERFALDLVADAVADLGPVVEDIRAWGRLDAFLAIDPTGRVRFRQAIVRDAAYQGLSFRKRRELHAAVGEALERRARRRPERYAELLSLHFDRAEIWPKAWEYSVMAGDRAAKKHAGAEAVALYGRALRAAEHIEDTDPSELLRVTEALGDAGELVGLYDEANRAYDKAVELAKDHVEVSGRLLRKKGFVQINRGDLDAASLFLERSLELLAGDEAPEVRSEHLETEIAIAGHLFRRGEYDACVEWCTQALALADDETTYERAIAHAYSLRSAAYTHLTGMDGAADTRRALAVFEKLGDLVAAADALNNLGYDAYYRGQWDIAIDVWSQSADARERAGDVVGSATALHNLGELALDQGRYEEAEDQLLRALRIWQGAAFKVGVPIAQANLARLATRAGRLDEASAYLALAEQGFTEMGAGAYLLETAVRRAEWLLFSGRPEEARTLALASLEVTEDSDGSQSLSAAFARILAYSEHLLGSGSAAERAALDRSLAHAREADVIFELAQTLEAQCRLDVTASREECHELLQRLGVIARPVIPGLV